MQLSIPGSPEVTAAARTDSQVRGCQSGAGFFTVTRRHKPPVALTRHCSIPPCRGASISNWISMVSSRLVHSQSNTSWIFCQAPFSWYWRTSLIVSATIKVVSMSMVSARAVRSTFMSILPLEERRTEYRPRGRAGLPSGYPPGVGPPLGPGKWRRHVGPLRPRAHGGGGRSGVGGGGMF